VSECAREGVQEAVVVGVRDGLVVGLDVVLELDQALAAIFAKELYGDTMSTSPQSRAQRGARTLRREIAPTAAHGTLKHFLTFLRTAR